MQNLIALLERTRLFKGFTKGEIASALLCLEGAVHRYGKRQAVYREAEPITDVGVVLSGTVYVGKEDEIGGQVIYSELTAGELVGEVSLLAGYDYGGFQAHAYNAHAAEESEILFIQIGKIVSPDGSMCALRSKIIENMLPLIVANNRLLYRKLDLVSHKSLRRRILHYLELQARRSHSNAFTIPFNRTDFADYLMVDRSALSRELCRMADDGLITFTRNRFQLHHTAR